MLRGMALTRLGRKAEATTAFKAITTAPKSEIASFWLLYLELGGAKAG
jgi:hypothetical protein